MVLTEIARNMKDTDSTGSPKSESAADTIETTAQGARPVPFSMRRRIGSTTYEVAVYFSGEAGETMDDKILRLVRGGTLNRKDGKNEEK